MGGFPNWNKNFFFGNFPSKSKGAGVGQNSLSICKEESQLLFALSLESDIFDLPSVRLPFNANVFNLFCEKDAGKMPLLWKKNLK